MLLSETTEILWRIARMDHQPRDTSDEAVMAWHELIGHLTFEDARAAVDRHRRTETVWLQPAHVVKGATAIAAERRRRTQAEEIEARGRAPQITPAGIRDLRLIYSESRALAITSGAPTARPPEADSQHQQRRVTPRRSLREPAALEARALGVSTADLTSARASNPHSATSDGA